TQHGYAADAHGGAGTAPMDPFAVAPPARAPARRSGGVSFLTILLLAAGFAGLLLGGVYVASQVTSREHDDSVPTTVPAPATAPAPTANPGPTTGANPVPPPVDPQPIVPRPTPVPGPGPKPTGTTKPSGQPTNQPPILPTVFVIPSALPFPFPP